MNKRIVYSQNFLKDRELVRRLVEKSSITSKDVVYEIGAGTGIITEELLKNANRVTAFEIDNDFYKKLMVKFGNNSSLILRQINFLDQILPNQLYKVFSNIPFNITALIIKKLTQSTNSPIDTYLIVQKEAAKKFIGKPYDLKNSQISILLNPWFEFTIFHNFQRDDFNPRPKVDTVMIRINKKEVPLISQQNKQKYEDFISYTFNQFKPNVVEGLSNVFGPQEINKLSNKLKFSPRSKPSELDFEIWIKLFDFFLTIDKSHQNLIKGFFLKLRKQEQKIEKINRTRTDKDWRNYKRTKVTQ